jgi:hypothetical protein
MEIKKIFYAGMLLASLIVVITGCEYNAPTAMYYQKQKATIKTSITKLDPDTEAGAGVNYITIIGENFSPVQEHNKVYFDGYEAEIVSNSATAITVRRPNKSGDSITVKVVTDSALEIAQYQGYKISSVFSPWGGFIGNDALNAVAVDKNENVYVIQGVPSTVYKVTPDGENSVIGEASKTATDAKIGPAGDLYLLMNQKTISRMNVNTGEETEWIDVGKRVSYGDFDSNGNFYVSGRRCGIIVIAPDNSAKTIDVYLRDEIFCVRVYEGYVYLLVETAAPDENTPKLAIWKHKILDSAGTLGDKELALDIATTGEYAESTINDFTFSQDGTMYIGTEYVQPVLVVKPDLSMDMLYKNILPGRAIKLVWGNGSYIYMIEGGDENNLLRVDIGAAGAPYYGR